MTEKYQVIKIQNYTLDSDILGTFLSYAESVEFMNMFIKENYELSSYLKAYHDNENTISIYEYFWVCPKKLVSKIHIVKYTEIYNSNEDYTD